MAKLWQKQYSLDKLIERYTVGEDYLLDSQLVYFDALASLAHADMLNKAGLLPDSDFAELKNALCELVGLIESGRFSIRPEDEDGHTAIENWLVDKTGEAGKKIHTGRSRNDQVLVALRLFMKHSVFELLGVIFSLTDVLVSRAKELADVPMPGRTHMQIAMPSSCGLWMAAFAEELADVARLLWAFYPLVDQNPLGAAASYGVPLPLDREYTASLLGFSSVQNNVLYANNSRGKFESIFTDLCEQVMLTLSKMAQDLILFSLPEFGYFKLPPELCTGSSIMPQKQNPDGLELMRAKSASVASFSMQIKGIIRSLPSGYNRDFQETKGPFMRAVGVTLDSVRVMERTISLLEIFPDNLKKGFSREIFATDEAYRLVREGMSFRDAYRKVALDLDKVAEKDPSESIRERKYPGTTGNLNLDFVEQRLDSLKQKVLPAKDAFEKALSSLVSS
ncbi:argininosuccinate lyase [Spirochaetia bacterium 38H-sp]|uniref:Argininosuccinate lyase n=1 Tax=Rarispira pelagica TaxID=3141764 RepID=A0ABU9UDE1_9SPIR